MLSRDELAAMMAAEEKRLGVGSREFMERHMEIMGLVDSIQNKKPPYGKPYPSMPLTCHNNKCVN